MIKQIFTKNARRQLDVIHRLYNTINFLFSSGQIPVNPENGEIVSGGIVPQAEQVMENIGAIFKRGRNGLSFGFKKQHVS